MTPLSWRLLSTSLLGVLSCCHGSAESKAYLPATSAAPSKGKSNTSREGVRPNVLVVIVDDLGWKDVGFHEPSFSTPHLDAMVAEGVELSTFYTAPTCTPSRAQLMTGRYSYRIGMQDSVLHTTEPRGVPLSETFVGEKLQAAGYTTAAVGKWHLGMHMPQYLPRERGFDDFYGILTGGGGHYSHMSVSQEFSPRGGAGRARTFNGPNIVEGDELSEESLDTRIHSTEMYTKKAAEYVEAMTAKGDPWFLYLSYQAIHDPIETDDTWINGRSCETLSAANSSGSANDGTDWDNRKIACGMVAQMDNGLGALRSLLEQLEEWDNTVVVFFSDNGGLPSHGSINHPFRGSKGDYWEGGVHVPAFFSGGFVTTALERNNVEPYRYGHLAHVTDIHATVLGLAGFSEDSGGNSLDGVDLWESLVQTKSAVRDSVVINLNSPNFAKSGAVRWGKYKLIRNPEPMESVIYSKVHAKLIDEGLEISESVLHKATSEVHALLHLSEPKMYLFDLKANPSETVDEDCGTDLKLGPPAACCNLYNIPAFRKVRLKMEGILDTADSESVVPTLRWMDDGPLADPLNFGGWVPWRDINGDPLASYKGATIESTGESGQESPEVDEVKLASLSRVGEEPGSVEDYTVTVTAAHASGLAIFIGIVSIAGTFFAYRAGQKSEYFPL